MNQALTISRSAFFMSKISRGTLAGQFRINNHNKARLFISEKDIFLVTTLNLKTHS
jgi:hypothetical protein